MSDTWIDRVRAADAEAEAWWVIADRGKDRAGVRYTEEQEQTHALIAIAAELRAARIAQRPGAGKS